MKESEDFLDALIRGDRRSANQLVDRMLDRGARLRDLYLDVMEPAMHEIGRRWEQNSVSVAEEHLATAITQAAMGRAFERVYRWHDSRSPSLIAACADEERHQIGLRMLCDLLELEGWDTTYLGASVPTESLVEMVRKRRPGVVALSTAIAPNLPRVRSAIAAIRQSGVTPMPLIVIGGRAVAGDGGLAMRLGADLTATTAADAVGALTARLADTAQ
ncbi:MAG TPA: B12-binding domain-containing protein [Gemmatimonadaceae bacterium]|jgi:methanogenic corrinoid protein MtbC1|nr:B12-binding domain-containing protein [Gemmatimonadaceae bacterium]